MPLSNTTPLRAAAGLCALVLSAGFAHADCGSDFVFPATPQTFNYLDVVNVQYTSNYSHPTLYTWCGISGLTAINQSTPSALLPCGSLATC